MGGNNALVSGPVFSQFCGQTCRL